MAELTRVSFFDLIRGTAGWIGFVNEFGTQADSQFDITTVKHSSAGLHDSDILLPMSRGKIEFTAGAPSATYAAGTFSSTVTDLGVGITKIGIGTSASSVNNIRVSVGLINPEGAVVANVDITEVDTIVVYTYDFNSDTLVDNDFSFAIWIA
jgi:hypothetical protein